MPTLSEEQSRENREREEAREKEAKKQRAIMKKGLKEAARKPALKRLAADFVPESPGSLLGAHFQNGARFQFLLLVVSKCLSVLGLWQLGHPGSDQPVSELSQSLFISRTSPLIRCAFCPNCWITSW